MTNKDKIVEALASLTKGVPCSFGVTTTGEVVGWNSPSGLATPSLDMINAEVLRLQAEYDAQEYARNRKAAYNALNQMELISDDSINGTTTHKDAILAIKAEFPKP